MKREELLMRIVDGEVDPGDAGEADALLREPVARAHVDELRQIGELVRAVEASRAPFPDIADDVLVRLSAERAALRSVTPSPAGRAPSEVRKLPLRGGRRLVAGVAGVAGVAAAVALAAAVTFVVQRERAPASSPTPVAQAPVRDVPEPGPVAVAASAGDAPVTLESVDFGAVQGAIFLVSGGPTETLVVWTFDEPDDKTRKVDL